MDQWKESVFSFNGYEWKWVLKERERECGEMGKFLVGYPELKDWWLGLLGQGRGKGVEVDDVWV